MRFAMVGIRARIKVTEPGYTLIIKRLARRIARIGQSI
jgi:hypothetical protein